MAAGRFLLCGHLAGSRHHRDRHHPSCQHARVSSKYSATPYGKTPIPTSPARSGISHISLFLSIFWDHLQASGLYFILLAGVVGTLTGLLITRNVTRRLRRITQAADAWSKGEFAVEVRDPTRDEIGQLGQDLNGMAEQLHTLLATREELATIEERNRLARDLHDSIKQNVFATALLVGAARTHLPPDTLPAQTYLAEAEALAEQTRQELTALIRELRPARLADKGLAVVLRDYAEDWSRRMGIAVAMHYPGGAGHRARHRGGALARGARKRSPTSRITAEPRTSPSTSYGTMRRCA